MVRIRTRLKLNISILLLMVTCISCTQGQRPSNLSPIKVLLSTSNQAPYDEDAAANVIATFNRAVFGVLLSLSPNFELQPGHIKSWRWDAATTTYELTLRDDITFHNGRHATAKDLEFTLLRGFFSTRRSFYRIYLQNIEGIDAVDTSRPFSTGAVSGVKVTGPYTLTLRLNAPNPAFLYSLTVAYFSLVPGEELEADMFTWKRLPVGAGPYRVTQAFMDGKTVLKREFGGGPANVELYTQLQPVAYDASIITWLEMEHDFYKVQHSEYPAIVWTIFFHNLNTLGVNQDFRKMIQAAVNSKALYAGFDKFSPTHEMLPSHFWGRADISDPYNLERAKELSRKLPKGLLNKVWRVPVFSGNPIPTDRAVVLDRLQKQFYEAGLKVEFYPSNDKFIRKETAIDTPINISGMVSDYVDPTIMFSAFHSKSPFSYERPKNDDKVFDDLYQASLNSKTKQERILNVRKLSEHFNDAVYAVPMLEMKTDYYYSKSRIKGLGIQNQPLYLVVENIRAIN